MDARVGYQHITVIDVQDNVIMRIYTMTSVTRINRSMLFLYHKFGNKIDIVWIDFQKNQDEISYVGSVSKLKSKILWTLWTTVAKRIKNVAIN